MTCKTSLVFRSEILGHFGNTLTSDHMCSRHRLEKLPQQVQSLLSQKRKAFWQNFIAFFQYTQNSQHFEKEDQLHSLNILEVIDHEISGYFNSGMPLL